MQRLLQIKRLAPPLSPTLYKGQAGRVAIIGGSEEYTGAPFYAGTSALRTGTDICHIICAPSAALPIKSYSPDLIVHPFLVVDDADAVTRCMSVIDRCHVVVVGPGLGRDEGVLRCVVEVIRCVRRRHMPLVVDADGLWMVQLDPDLVHGYAKAVITPNMVEFKRIWDKVGDGRVPSPTASDLSKKLGNVTVLQKGPTDKISNGIDEWSCDEAGGLRRCGGQGDVLSGVLAAFLCWTRGYESGLWGERDAADGDLTLLACLGASIVTRRCSRIAFESAGRSMVAVDMISAIGKVVHKMLDAEDDDAKL